MNVAKQTIKKTNGSLLTSCMISCCEKPHSSLIPSLSIDQFTAGQLHSRGLRPIRYSVIKDIGQRTIEKTAGNITGHAVLHMIRSQVS